MTTEESANTSDKRPLTKLSKQELEKVADEINKLDDDEQIKRYDEEFKKIEDDYRQSLSDMKLPKGYVSYLRSSSRA